MLTSLLITALFAGIVVLLASGMDHLYRTHDRLPFQSWMGTTIIQTAPRRTVVCLVPGITTAILLSVNVFYAIDGTAKTTMAGEHSILTSLGVMLVALEVVYFLGVAHMVRRSRIR